MFIGVAQLFEAQCGLCSRDQSDHFNTSQYHHYNVADVSNVRVVVCVCFLLKVAKAPPPLFLSQYYKDYKSRPTSLYPSINYSYINQLSVSASC